MFLYDIRENRGNQIEITDIDYETMQQFLTYIYTGEISNLEENQINLFIVADKVSRKFGMRW